MTNKILIHKMQTRTSYPKPYYLPGDIPMGEVEHFIEYVPKAVADDVLKENMVLQKRLDELDAKLEKVEEEFLNPYSNGWDDGVKDALKDIKAIHEKYKDSDLNNILPIVDELWQAIATTVKNVREIE